LKKRYTLYYYFILILVACNSNNENHATSNSNSDIITNSKTTALFKKKTAKQTNIDFKNSLNDNIGGRYNALTFPSIFNGGGVGVADLNNDGLQDIYFTGNMVSDQLYLNKGNFQFENITQKAGIVSKGWSNGVSFVDINKDGYLDIYVCKGGPELDPNIKQNKLYINQKNLTFKEEAEKYGLNDNRISTQAAFFDFDKDGDQDCFVMNNAIYHSADVFGNDKKIKSQPNFLQANSNALYENRNGQFVDISIAAGIQKFTYGLGLLIQDFNDDSFPDIYVANDYYIPDYMFINNKNGTFTDNIKKHTRQTAFYSMGADAADINNDGLMDFAVLDMSSNDHIRNKTLMPSMNVNLFYTLVAHFRYQPQFMFNALQMNNGNGTYSNIAQMAGMANSDWSWSILWADFDLDSWQDCHITNGIKRYINDNDFRRSIEALNVKANAGQTITSEEKRNLYASIPQLKVNNVAYQNKGDLTFAEQSKNWNINEALNSNGAAYADLDNDGDLDLITNNLDEAASVFENTASNANNFISINLPYNTTNTKVEVYVNDKVQAKEYHPVRGFQSSQDHRLNFGLGKQTQADSILIIWQDNTLTKLTEIKANQFITPKKGNVKKSNKAIDKTYFTQIEPEDIDIDFIHKENKYTDYEKETLLPYLQSTLGPKISVGDINNDGLDDFYIGGASNNSGALYTQNQNTKFTKINGPWQADKLSEDMGSLFFDTDNDGDLDLYVCSGGNAIDSGNPTLQDRLYINKGNNQFEKSNQLPKINIVSAVVAAADYDSDGDIDLFIGGRHQPQKYPLAESSYLLINEKGTFQIDKNNNLIEAQIGLVNDAKWIDIDNDEDEDLIIATEWGPVHTIENENGKLKKANEKWGTEKYYGWWQSINIADFDGDGDIDILAGNLGLNSKYKASHEKPLKLYAGDFDKNGTHDIFLSKKYKTDYVPLRGFECSSEQMPQLQQQFESYQKFASSNINEVLGIEQNNEAEIFQTNTFQSGIFVNENNRFKFEKLPNIAQTSPIMASIVTDVNQDQKPDFITFGNIYNTEPETPSLDALSSKLFINKGNSQFKYVPVQQSGLNILANLKDAKNLKTVKGTLIVVSVNNAKPIVLEL